MKEERFFSQNVDMDGEGPLCTTIWCGSMRDVHN